MTCPTCHRGNLYASDFTIVRDGKTLPTRECRQCLRTADVAHNRTQNRRK